MTDSPDNPNPSKDSTLEPSKIIRGLAVSMEKLELAKDKLNLHQFTSAMKALRQDCERLEQNWREFLEQQETTLTDLQKQISDPEYSVSLESALKDQKVSFSGAFPNYDIPPFKLQIDVAKCSAKLSMGKKSQQNNSLSPKSIAQWVNEKYKRLLNSSFNHEQFCKELARAYQYISRGDWGTPVLIKDIYQILTIRAEAKKEYDEAQFIFELSRLLMLYEVRYKDKNDEYIFDFSAHKQPSKNYTVVNQFGIQKAVGNLTIRKMVQ
jgi:hypothetical protein